MPALINPSAFTPFATLANYVAAHIPQAPVFMLQDMARLAAQEFCRRSHIWRSGDITLLTTVAAQASYTLTPPTNAELLLVHSAWDGETELDVELPGEADEEAPGTSSSTSTDFKVCTRTENRIQLAPAPASAGIVIKGTASFIPTSAGAGLPTYLYDRWGRQIACYAAAQMVIEPKREWSDPGVYQGLLQCFDRAVSEASNEAGPVRRRPLRVKSWG